MKRALIVVAVLLIAVLGALVAAPWLVSTDQMNQRIAAQLTRLAGRDITFSGEPTVRLFPTAEIELRDVRIAGPGGFASEPLASIGEIRGQVSRLPLLLGRIEIDSFELVRPRIHLQVGPAGEVNWALAGLTAPAPDGGDDALALAETRIGRFVVRNGHVLYENAATGATTELAAVDLELNWPSLGKSAAVVGSAVWRGEEIEFNGSLTTPAALVSGRPSLLRFALGSTPLKVSFDGSVSTLAGIQLDGAMTVTTPSIRRLIEWGGADVNPGASLNAASITGAAHLSGGSLDIANGVIEFDGNRAEGGLSLKHLATRPLVQGTLAFSSLDVSPYWEAFLASLRRAGAWFTAPIELAPLHLADVDLRLSSPQLVVGDTTLRDVAATLVSNQGRIAVNVGRAELFGGSLKASLNGEFRHDRLYFRGQGRIAGMPAAPAGRAIAGFAVLEGPADLAVDVTGAGRSWGELVGELSGRLELAVAAGRLNGIDLPRFAARVAASPDEETEPDRSGSTAFSRLSATASLDGGLLVSDDIVIDGDAYAVRLKGSSSLAGAAISGTGEIVLKAAEGPAIPLLVGGTWSAPTITVDRDRFDLGRVGEPG